MRPDHTTVKCLDIVGCRSNFFIERTRDIPVGCPLDQFEPVFKKDGTYDLNRFEWIFVDVYMQDDDWSEGFQDMPDLHRLYTGAHLYPLDTVKFLIEDGFLQPCRKTMPFGWAPLHWRPADVLRKGFRAIKDLWEAIPDAEFSDDPGTAASFRKNSCKSMILALIGRWSTQQVKSVTCYRTCSPETDVQGHVAAKTFSDLGTRGISTLSWTETEIVDTRSMLPLALQCRFHEALLMHKSMCLIEKLPRIVPLAVRVDAV